MNLNEAVTDMSSLSLFYRDVKRVERLNREEESALARRWHDHQDREAAQQLVVGNLYGVAAIAREYRHFGLQEADLIQEGTLGLMHAVKRFDPDRGFRLMTYASWWIRAAIHDFILHSWSIVKLGTNKLQRKIFAGLKKAKNAIAALDGDHVDEVAAEYGISSHEYQETANAYLQRDVSLDADMEEGEALITALPALEATPEELVVESNWQDHQNSQLHSALKELSDRDRHIVMQRHLAEEPATLKDLSEGLGVSIERVRQLEKRAMNKLREVLAN
ncbi:MAG: sigma-70 family RNA polymerase sigma factor [Mariprofundaceae bacterium]|nr:sigma-70 family RNA polymerase sigma factor [Mariprofundaceae bacterium]